MHKMDLFVQPSISTIISDPDIISTLPDDVLCQILCFLPAKYAIRTSILSSRWTHLMKSVPVLNFECDSAPAPGFIHTLNNLLSDNRSADLQKLQLSLSNCYRSIVPLVNDWVHLAIQHKVAKLDIEVTKFIGYRKKHQGGDLRIIASDSLEVLKLHGVLCLNMPTSGCFNKLKTFDVQLNDPNDELLSKLFCSLPQLEELAVEAKFSTSKKDLKFCVNIILPALRTLFLFISGENLNNVDFEVLIDTPVLKKIYLGDDYMASYSLKCAYSVVEATLYVGQNYELDHRVMEVDARAAELVKGMPYMERLSVSNDAPLALVDPGVKFPLLQHLIYLEMLFLLPSCGSKVLPKLLHNAPNLKVIVLKIPTMVKDCSDWVWISPETIPTCLLNLQEIRIEGAANVRAPSFWRMVNFLMVNAQVGKKFDFSADEDEVTSK